MKWVKTNEHCFHFFRTALAPLLRYHGQRKAIESLNKDLLATSSNQGTGS
jgi:hypothetical protein